MRSLFFAAMAIAAFNPISAFARTVIVQPGDTLSDIAKRNKVSVSELIIHNRIRNSNNLWVGQKILIPDITEKKINQVKTYNIKRGDTLNEIAIRFRSSNEEIMRLNRIENSDYLFEGQVLKIPTKSEKTTKMSSPNGNQLIHQVKSGETLGEISMNYKSSRKTIIKANNINDPNNIYPGQKIIIPQEATNSSYIEERKNLGYHIFAQGDTLFSIAKTYKIPLQKILDVNQIDDPSQIKIGTRINLEKKIAKNNVRIINKAGRLKDNNKWRTYGPIKIDWSNWKSLGGSYITPTVNKNGKALYLAVNCKANKLNATGKDGSWKNWIKPIEKFEHDLIKDLCKSKKS